LSGANYAPWVPPFPAYVPMPAQQPGKGIGHFFGAMRVDAFRTVAEYQKDMDHWIQGFRNARTIPGEEKVLVPGDPEREIELYRRENGISLFPSVLEELTTLAERLNVPFPSGL
ncbi:MAG: Ldh family oxidoreductase, partial [Pedobacter sp.]